MHTCTRTIAARLIHTTTLYYHNILGLRLAVTDLTIHHIQNISFSDETITIQTFEFPQYHRDQHPSDVKHLIARLGHRRYQSIMSIASQCHTPQTSPDASVRHKVSSIPALREIL
jgi:hypothetical protein